MLYENCEIELRKLLEEITQQDLSQVRSDADLEETLGLDSLDRLTFAAEVEDRFQLVISDERLAGLKTLSDLAGAVETTLREAA